MSRLLTRFAPMIESALRVCVPTEGFPQHLVAEACNYSLLAGGKRLRPALLLAFYEQCGGRAEDALPFSCALECIHTYSLIHDDLPAMDNDDLRRGKPTNHRVFGEDMAILAGDALLNRAFELMMDARDVDAERARACAGYIARQSGIFGMVGGQCLDLDPALDDGLMDTMIDLKTGALLRAACVGGVLLAGGSAEQAAAAERYAAAVGKAFQITDDLLDLEGTTAQLGKETGHDAASGKRTFPARYGVERCKALVREYTDAARSAVQCFPHPEELAELADELAVRDR